MFIMRFMCLTFPQLRSGEPDGLNGLKNFTTQGKPDRDEAQLLARHHHRYQTSWKRIAKHKHSHLLFLLDVR
jgi:hypothetical protein